MGRRRARRRRGQGSRAAAPGPAPDRGDRAGGRRRSRCRPGSGTAAVANAMAGSRLNWAIRRRGGGELPPSLPSPARSPKGRHPRHHHHEHHEDDPPAREALYQECVRRGWKRQPSLRRQSASVPLRPLTWPLPPRAGLVFVRRGAWPEARDRRPVFVCPEGPRAPHRRWGLTRHDSSRLQPAAPRTKRGARATLSSGFLDLLK